MVAIFSVPYAADNQCSNARPPLQTNQSRTRAFQPFCQQYARYRQAPNTCAHDEVHFARGSGRQSDRAVRACSPLNGETFWAPIGATIALMPRPSWNDSYASGEPLPWDTGTPDPMLVEMIESHAI